MNEKTKIALAKKNNRAEDYRKQAIAKEVADYYALSKEIGIIGDALEYLFSIVSELHNGVLPDSAFIEWRNKVSEIKNKVSTEILINK
jgi:cation transport regulator ChaC